MALCRILPQRGQGGKGYRFRLDVDAVLAYSGAAQSFQLTSRGQAIKEHPMKSVTIDRNKRLKDESHLGHNRWHPDIPPILEVDLGEEVVLETRDASDCQIKPGMTVADLSRLDSKVAHPLTGPVYIKGAKPGDLLEIEYLDIVPQSVGWTRNRPGAGFLRDLFPEPYLVHWEMKDGWATSPQLPGVRIPNGSFMGTAARPIGGMDKAGGRAGCSRWARVSPRSRRCRAVRRGDRPPGPAHTAAA